MDDFSQKFSTPGQLPAAPRDAHAMQCPDHGRKKPRRLDLWPCHGIDSQPQPALKVPSGKHTKSYWNMAIEIVDLPILKIVIFQFAM